MKKTNIFTDVIHLTMGHNIIAGNVPDVIPIEKFCHSPEHRTKNDIEQFGLFDSSSPNYNTYYPEVKPEDLKPSDAEFIQPMFRALSEVIVHKSFNPVDFGKNGVLKKSMPLLVGQTINVDHERFMVGSAVGSIPKVAWDEGYTAEKNIKVPAGINAVLKIDGKANPRIARGIMMEPPSIHSSSVTIQFKWEKSHPQLTDDEFFRKLASYDDKGQLIRRIAVEIENYHELSLVTHGADPFAQKIGKDGKIVNPIYAGKTYFKQLSADLQEKANESFYFFDWKADIISNAEEITIPLESNDENEIQMNKELQTFLLSLATVMGLTAKPEGEEFTQEEVTTGVTGLLTQLNEKKTLETEIIGLRDIKTKYEQLQLTAAESASLKAFMDSRTKELRDETLRKYNLLFINNKDSNMVGLIEKANYETLNVLNMQYGTQLDAAVPLICEDCGSKKVSRKSSKSKETQGEGEKDSFDEIVNQKTKKGRFSLYPVEETK